MHRIYHTCSWHKSWERVVIHFPVCSRSGTKFFDVPDYRRRPSRPEAPLVWSGEHTQDPMVCLDDTAGRLVVWMCSPKCSEWEEHEWSADVGDVYDSWLPDLARCAMGMGGASQAEWVEGELVPRSSDTPNGGWIRDVEFALQEVQVQLREAAKLVLVHPGRRIRKLNPKTWCTPSIFLGQSLAQSYMYPTRQACLVGEYFAGLTLSNVYTPHSLKLTTTALLVNALGGLIEKRATGADAQVELAAVMGVVMQDDSSLPDGIGKGCELIVISTHATYADMFIVGAKNRVFEIRRDNLRIRPAKLNWRGRMMILSIQRVAIRCTGGTTAAPVHDALLAISPVKLHLPSDFGGWGLELA